MISYMFACILAGALIYLGLLNESTALALMGFAVFILMFISLADILWKRKKIQIQLDLPIRVIEKNQTVHLYLLIQNHWVLGISKLHLQLKYSGTGLARKKKIWVRATQLLSGTTKCMQELALTEAGRYVFCLRKIRCYDWTGFFYMDFKQSDERTVIVLPQLKDTLIVLGEAIRNYYGEAIIYDKLHPGYDPSETFDIREFRNGDRIQSIHWKMSAKMGDLMVRESSLPCACPVVFFWDARIMENTGMLEQAASISFSLMDTKCPHYIVWKSLLMQDIVRVRVDDEESFFYALTNYMEDIDKSEQQDLVNQYIEKYRGEQYLHDLVLKDIGCLLLDGEDLNYSSLEELELILV